MILFPSGVKVVSGLDLCSYRCGCAGAYLQHAAYHRILHRHISFVMNLFPADLIFLILTPISTASGCCTPKPEDAKETGQDGIGLENACDFEYDCWIDHIGQQHPNVFALLDRSFCSLLETFMGNLTFQAKRKHELFERFINAWVVLGLENDVTLPYAHSVRYRMGWLAVAPQP